LTAKESKMNGERSGSFGTSDDAMPKGELRYPSSLQIDSKFSSSHDLLSPSNANIMYKGSGEKDDNDGLLLFVPAFHSIEMPRDAKSRTPSRGPSKNASPVASGRSTPRFAGHLSGTGSVRSTSPTDNQDLNTSPRALLMRNKMRDLLLEESNKQPRRPIILERDDDSSDTKPLSSTERMPMLSEISEESSDSFKR